MTENDEAMLRKQLEGKVLSAKIDEIVQRVKDKEESNEE